MCMPYTLYPSETHRQLLFFESASGQNLPPIDHQPTLGQHGVDTQISVKYQQVRILAGFQAALAGVQAGALSGVGCHDLQAVFHRKAGLQPPPVSEQALDVPHTERQHGKRPGLPVSRPGKVL